MGSPNFLISNSSLSLIGRKLFTDIGLEISFTSMIDLDGKGSIVGVESEYQMDENIYLLFGINNIAGNKNVEMNQLNTMEDFSHARLELKYYY